MFNKINSKVLAATATAAVFMSTNAYAASLGDIAANLRGQGKDMYEAGIAISMVVGIIMLIMGILKFKAYSDNPQQNSIGAALTRVVVGAALMAPSAIGMTVADSTVNDSKQGQNINAQSFGDYQNHKGSWGSE